MSGGEGLAVEVSVGCHMQSREIDAGCDHLGSHGTGLLQSSSCTGDIPSTSMGSNNHIGEATRGFLHLLSELITKRLNTED